MRTKQIFAIIDTETAGSIGFPLIYDLGITIVDITGKVLASDNWLIKNIFFNTRLMDSAYYGNKRPLYYDKIANDEIKVASFKQAMFELNKMLVDFGVSHVTAYNNNFDFRALRSTAKFTKLEWKKSWKRHPYLWNSYETLCIWGLCCETIYNTEEFVNECHANNWLTTKGNPLTNAEVGYNFVMNTTSFEESHTALHDTQIEAILLIRALRTKIDHSDCDVFNPWRIVANFNKKLQEV